MTIDDIKPGTTVIHNRTGNRYVVMALVEVRISREDYWQDGVAYRREGSGSMDPIDSYVRGLEDFIRAFRLAEANHEAGF